MFLGLLQMFSDEFKLGSYYLFKIKPNSFINFLKSFLSYKLGHSIKLSDLAKILEP